MPLFCELADFSSVNEIRTLSLWRRGCRCITLYDMGRPPETFSKVAAALGVTRQAVYKWHQAGAPFHSAGELYDWLNRPFVRVLDDYNRPQWIAALAGVLPP